MINLTSELEKYKNISEILDNEWSVEYPEGVDLADVMYDNNKEIDAFVKYLTAKFSKGKQVRDVNDEQDVLLWKVEFKNTKLILAAALPTKILGGYINAIPAKSFESDKDFEHTEEAYGIVCKNMY